MFLFLYKKFYLCCRYKLNNFIYLVQIGDLPGLQYCETFSSFNEDTVIRLLDVGVALNKTSIVEYLLEKYKDFETVKKYLNPYLEFASQENRMHMCEILVKSGADPRKGLKYSKSPNITKMLYRYINGFEMVN